MANRSHPRDQGFTLLEVLAAIAVMGFLITGLTQGTLVGLRAWAVEMRLVGQRGDIESVERVLRDLVAQADPGAFNELAQFRGSDRLVSFPTRLPLSARDLPASEVDVGLGVDERRRLVLRWEAHPHAERLASVPVNETILLENVDHLELSYRAPPEQGGGWTTTWAAGTLPALVRMQIVFPQGDVRHWPAIVAAPMRARLETFRP